MRQLDRDLHPFGLSMHDYEILVELSEATRSRLRMTELADRTAQSRSRLSHQVSRMESRGLVVREGCEGDKRGTFAVLTDARRGDHRPGRPAPRRQRPASTSSTSSPADASAPSPRRANRSSTSLRQTRERD